MPFSAFVPGGEIPWHRVPGPGRRRRSSGDRHARHLIARGHRGRTRTSSGSSRRTFECDPASWDDLASRQYARGRLRWTRPAPLRRHVEHPLDRYDADRIFHRAMVRLLDALASLDADLIALQEVEPVFVDAFSARITGTRGLLVMRRSRGEGTSTLTDSSFRAGRSELRPSSFLAPQGRACGGEIDGLHGPRR